MARTRGWHVLTGHSYDSDGMPPYLPFVEALRDYILECEPARLHKQVGDSGPELSLLLPEIAKILPGAETLPPGTDRYQSTFPYLGTPHDGYDTPSS